MRALVLCLLLTGCTAIPEVNQISEEYVSARRSLHNDLTDLAQSWICRGMSIYEWRRWIDTPEKAQAWQVLCDGATEVPVSGGGE